jgi:hypothetical protein
LETWKEAVVAYFEILSRNLPDEAKENHEKSQSGWPANGLRFKPGQCIGFAQADAQLPDATT